MVILYPKIPVLNFNLKRTNVNYYELIRLSNILNKFDSYNCLSNDFNSNIFLNIGNLSNKVSRNYFKFVPFTDRD